MDDIIIARVLAVLMLIGGLPLVTGVVLRSIRRNIGPDEHLDAFQRIEPLFAPQTCFWGDC